MDPYIKTPDFYAKNYGVEVIQEQREPESGRVKIRLIQNPRQSMIIQIGLEQAKELNVKLGEVIESIEADGIPQ